MMQALQLLKGTSWNEATLNSQKIKAIALAIYKLCTFIIYAISIASKKSSAICAIVGGGGGHGVITKDSTIIISKQLNDTN